MKRRAPCPGGRGSAEPGDGARQRRRRRRLTAGRKARVDWKALSKRVGHSDVAFTMRQYVETDLDADREVANTLAELIIGGSLASFMADSEPDDTRSPDEDNEDKEGDDQGDEDPAA